MNRMKSKLAVLAATAAIGTAVFCAPSANAYTRNAFPVPTGCANGGNQVISWDLSAGKPSAWLIFDTNSSSGTPAASGSVPGSAGHRGFFTIGLNYAGKYLFLQNSTGTSTVSVQCS